MLRKLIIGSSLLLASATYADFQDEPTLDQDLINEEMDYENENSDLDLAEHDLDWHVEINKDNKLGKASFHVGSERELIAIVDLAGLDPNDLQIIDSGLGFLSIQLKPLVKAEETANVQIVMQTNNVPFDQIVAEIANGKLAVTIPENVSPRAVKVDYKNSIDELSIFKAAIEDRAAEEEVDETTMDETKEDL